jgi:tetratricopeptide (TPR) repeat protein
VTTAPAGVSAPRAPGGRPSVLDPHGVIHQMEDHDRAFHLWRDAGVRERILVHIDAHHDMWWVDDAHALSIANFICPALKDRIVREVHWVVPDHSWDTSAGRAVLGRHLRRIGARYPGGLGPIRREHHRIRTTVLGRPLIICSIDSLAVADEPVLLDIDTDYLMIPRVSFAHGDTHSPLPWRWPGALIGRLDAAAIRTDFATVAYSVDGGYTPLAWKYLGDEITARLRLPDGDDRLEPYDGMRLGAVAEADGDDVRAEAAYLDVGDRLGAATDFRLAHLMAKQGRVEEGRYRYNRAMEADSSYCNRFASPGWSLYISRSCAAAERAFSRTLLLDPDDAYAHLGLGWLAGRRKDWTQAGERARSVLRLVPDSIDGHRLLGRTCVAQGRFVDAIDSYERTLKLALAGHRPISGVIATDPEGDRLFDADHAVTHARLARLYAATGDVKRAIAGYRIAIAAGCDIPSVRFRVARLLIGQGRWRDAWPHASAGVKRTPGAVWSAVARKWRR